MNDLLLEAVRDRAEVRRPNRRSLAKLRTREKVIASASALFAAKGYEGATIRDIADAAGFSTGAVFNNFEDKFSLFAEIVGGQRQRIYEAMRQAARGAALHADLDAMFCAGYRAALDDLPLLQAATSMSWTHDLGARVRERLALWPAADLLADALRAGVARSELAADTDVGLVSQMLWDGFLANLGYAAFSGWSLEALTERMMRMARIMAPAAPRPSGP